VHGRNVCTGCIPSQLGSSPPRWGERQAGGCRAALCSSAREQVRQAGCSCARC